SRSASSSRCRGAPYRPCQQEQGEARLATFDCRPDEAAQSRQRNFGTQGAGKGVELHWRYERLRQDEYLAAQAGNGQARRERWQSARLAQGLEPSSANVRAFWLVNDELAAWAVAISLRYRGAC